MTGKAKTEKLSVGFTENGRPAIAGLQRGRGNTEGIAAFQRLMQKHGSQARVADVVRKETGVENIMAKLPS